MLGKFIKHEEDSLTASVIGHLLHLPIELFWQLIREASIGNELPEFCGEPESVDFWPKWNADDTNNSKYVEPDVFLRFSDFDLIIEAKRWDGQMQYKGQWKNELIAYHNEYANDKRNVKILALGGIGNQSNENISIGTRTEEFAVLKCTWDSLLHKCKELKRELSGIKFNQSNLLSQKRIVADVVDLFAWHGFSTGRWAADFDFGTNRLVEYKQSIDTFRTIRNNF